MWNKHFDRLILNSTKLNLGWPLILTNFVNFLLNFYELNQNRNFEQKESK